MGLKPRESIAAGEAAALLRGGYPSFIYRGRCPDLEAGYVPVFAFHSIDPADFDRKLRYLDANGYATVLVDEVTSAMAGKGTLPSRPVALTIDDGHHKSTGGVFDPQQTLIDAPRWSATSTGGPGVHDGIQVMVDSATPRRCAAIEP